MAYREFNIACINKVSKLDMPRLYFDYQVQNEITYVLWEHLTALAQMRPGGWGFIPGPGWFLKASDLYTHDVVVYFVSDRSQSVAVRAGGSIPPDDAAGFTSPTPTGVVSEVYVEMNLPARKLANIAFTKSCTTSSTSGAV